MLKFIHTSIAVLALATGNAAASGEHAEEANLSLDQEIALAREILDDNENLIVARVYGLICETCAHGLSIHFNRLKSVDRKRLEKGIKIDVFNQMLIVALKPGAEIGVNEIYQAILNAGYEPKTLFLMDSVDSIIDERQFTVKRSRDIHFELLNGDESDLLEHGKQHDMLLVAPAVKAKKVESLKAHLIDTLHES